MIDGPRALALIACDLCGKREVPPHIEHQGSGCDLWRTFLPYAELQRQGYGKQSGFEMSGAEWAWKDDAVLEENVDIIAARFDCVVLPRLSWSDHRVARRFIDALHRANLAVIGEYDDDLFSEAINGRILQSTEPDAIPEDLERRRVDRLTALRMTDGVTVSSRRLATVIRSLVDKPVVVVENAIDTRWWKACRKEAKRFIPGLTIGWSGGNRPADDLRPLAVAWGQVAQRRPDVTFVIYGHQPDVISDYLPDHRIRRIPWHPLASYPFPFVNFDIGCAAVTDDPFNRCKTVIKCWEYTMGGAAVVATPALYGQAITDGQDGLLAESADQWEDALLRLVDDAELRRTLWRGQRRRVMREHSLEQNAWRWPAAWQAIVSDFQARRAVRSRLVGVA
jgi:glycosyltransferase involved in cell wall biosynthesis